MASPFDYDWRYLAGRATRWGGIKLITLADRLDQNRTGVLMNTTVVGSLRAGDHSLIFNVVGEQDQGREAFRTRLRNVHTSQRGRLGYDYLGPVADSEPDPGPDFKPPGPDVGPAGVW